MALSRARLTEVVQLAAAAASVYANPANCKTFIRGLTLFNSNTTDEVVKIYLVPDTAGAVGTAAVANQVAELTMTPKQLLLYEIPYSWMLTDANDTLQMSSTTANKVNAVVAGDKDMQ